MRAPAHWDLDYDVVVAGYGYAGAMAAMTAHDAGARVALFEKMAHPGGNSILSGGACLVGTDYDATLAYLRRTLADATDPAVVEVYARGMVALPELLQQLAGEVGFDTAVNRHNAGTYPFPGYEQLVAVYVTRNDKYTGFSWAKGTKAGGTLFWVVLRQMERRPAIDVRFNAPVRDLVLDDSGTVLGVNVEIEGQRLNARARRAVVLCTGGFEHNARLLQHYLDSHDSTAVSPLGNTGDGILMAQKAGAALWHMWLIHGGYGFRVPDVPFALRHNYPGYRNAERRMPWIALDRFGRRFMDEYPPAPQDTPFRTLQHWDPDLQDYPRIPCYLVFDEEGRKLDKLAWPVINDAAIDFTWSDDNLAEIEKGYVKRADTLAALAAQIGLDPEAVQESVDRWNEHCRRGEDRDYRRPPGTMLPIVTPPFYCIEAWPIITNTQGGPVHNARQQVLDAFGHPIPRLYKAGEMGSVFGHVYALGGNNSECFIGGPIAGREAAAEPPWC
ncbi:MAG TPA: FAD-dependent oxidoreductase [Chloroflexota bacterium]|jgi:succinate dehydrogenase/fumarate reductase flavoprotein subunit